MGTFVQKKHLNPLWLVAHDHMHAVIFFFPNFVMSRLWWSSTNDVGDWHLAILILNLYTSIP
jgi:hypothetical protein